MGKPKGAMAALVAAGLLTAVTTFAGGRPPAPQPTAAGGRDGYCVPTSSIPVGNICILVG